MFTPHEETNYSKSNLQEGPISNYMEIKAQHGVCRAVSLIVHERTYRRSHLSLCFSLYTSVCAPHPRQNPVLDLHVCWSHRINKTQLKIADFVFAVMILLTILYHPSNKENNERREINKYLL